MFEYLQNWLRQIEYTHGVNPVVFAIIYFAGVIPFWLSLYKIINAVRNKNYVQARNFGIVLGIIIIAPFTYVAIFGHHLPAWFYVVAVIIISYSIFSVVRKITKART
ncbi:MAG: hypothetical protein JSV53_01005 [candidate division WOR-3 bacterium]|nr:MAG: hypothetical protein JSV53_01005 [candidate division WOR-3 bacterium]